MGIKTSSYELNAMNESIVKHICWHLILLNRNTRFLFESFDPYHSSLMYFVILASNTTKPFFILGVSSLYRLTLAGNPTVMDFADHRA